MMWQSIKNWLKNNLQIDFDSKASKEDLKLAEKIQDTEIKKSNELINKSTKSRKKIKNK